MTMQMTPIDSSLVKAGCHEDGILTLELVNGQRFEYHNVPADVFEKLKNAPSPGKFFNQKIKPRYRCAKL